MLGSQDEGVPQVEKSSPVGTHWTIVGAVGALAITLGSLIYSFGQNQSATEAVQQNHTAQIQQLQITLNSQQTLLYAINDTLARLAQKISDQEAFQRKKDEKLYQQGAGRGQ